MIPIIYNQNFEALAEIDEYISFIWTERYYQSGDFELVVPITKKTVDLCRYGNYVHRLDRDDYGIIEKIKYNTSIDGVEQLVVSGRFLASILGRRIIAVQTEFNNKTVGQIVQKLVDDAIISPTDSARKINDFSYSDISGNTTKISVQYTGKNLLTTMEDLCLSNYLGFKIIYDNGFKMTTYSGTDRSYNQTENPYVVFSTDFDNLASSEYFEDFTELKTNVLIAGEGQGTERKSAWVTKDNPTGLQRYEYFKDARNVSSNNGAISDSVYMQQLKDEGLEYISTMSKAFTGEVFFNNYTFRKDVNVGDLVTIKNPNWNIFINTRLIEMVESTDETGLYTTTPTFGN